MTGMLKVMTAWGFHECLAGKAFPWNIRETFYLAILSCFVLPILYLHYTYPHYPHIVRSAFQRENPRIHTWELEIVIPTIIYTYTKINKLQKLNSSFYPTSQNGMQYKTKKAKARSRLVKLLSNRIYYSIVHVCCY